MAYTMGYTCDMSSPNCRMEGLIFDPEYIKSKFNNEVKERLMDQKGSQQLINEFADIASTDFQSTELENIFSYEDKDYEPWQIGEAFSEFFLEENRSVRFSSHTLRDLKNPNASSTGTDIVGFIDLGGETLFVFGEVKTSSDVKSPPGLLTGRSGMKKQIKDLTKDSDVKDNLVKYLGHKVVDMPEDNNFVIDYRKALKLYVDNKLKVHLYGILVRDRPCMETDLKTRYIEYKNNLDVSTLLNFIGLYIPINVEKWNNMIKGV